MFGKFKEKILKQDFVILLLILTFVKGLLWLAIIPIWQAPDEANHFAYVQFLAESGKFNLGREKNVSQELENATELMNFNWSSIHPVWRPEFSRSHDGLNEDEVRKIENSQRKEFTRTASGTRNPPLYYLLGSIFYRIAGFGSILERAYTVRLFSVLVSVLIVYASYLLTVALTKNKFLSLSISSVISFQPSFTFLGSTINNDILVIGAFTFFVFFLSKFISGQGRFGNFYLAAIAFCLGVLTKINFVSGVLLLPFVFAKRELPLKSNIFPLSILVIILSFITTFSISRNIGIFTDFFFFSKVAFEDLFFTGSFVKYLSSNLSHYNGEVFPWYWGIFGWLEVPLPLVSYRILKVLTFLSLIGTILLVFRKSGRLQGISLKTFWFVLISSLVPSLFVVFFDWETFVLRGSSFGLQGRHFLQSITPQMIIFCVGLISLVPHVFKKIVLSSLTVFFVVLNFLGIISSLEYFYQTQDLSLLFLRLDQYHPVFLKGFVSPTIFLLFFSLVLLFFFSYFKLYFRSPDDIFDSKKVNIDK